MSITTERLYELLPVILRQRDVERGEPLKALFKVFAREGRLLEEDLERLYDNLFIETCDEWAVPYLGDLLGVRGLNETGASGFSQRGRVANVLALRRGKGTAATLEQLAVDTTGWRARVVEYFELLATTQWLNHLRLHSLQIPDLRRGEAMDRLGTPFEETRHFVDVRRIASERGRYNLPNVGIHLWRLQSDYLRGFAARSAPGSGPAAAKGRFLTNPLELDAPLFNRPQTETQLTALASELNVPGMLRRRALDAEVEARRLALVNDDPLPEAWFGREAVFAVAYRLVAGGAFIDVKPEEMIIAHLDGVSPALPEVWLRPPTKLTYLRRSDQASIDVPIALAIDPLLGRIAFPAGVVPVEVRVSAAHGFPGDLGGGAYDRRETVEGLPSREAESDGNAAGFASASDDNETVDPFPVDEVTWQAGVGRDVTADPAARLFNTFEDAVDAWNAAPAATTGIVALLDSGSYAHGGVVLNLKRGSRLLVVSADWPERPQDGGGTARIIGDVSAAGVRAHLRGRIDVQSAANSELWFDGVLSEGELRLLNAGGAGLTRLRLAHTTLTPNGAGTLTVQAAHDALAVELYRSIAGAIAVAAPARELRIRESIVDVGEGDAVDAVRTPTEINASTVVGAVQVRDLRASNTIFMGEVRVERRQEGCVRFCFVPDGSITPRRFRCQPDLALEGVSAAEEDAILDRLRPDFTDERYGRPAYLQLTRTTPGEIRTGADDGSEMGAWHFLRQPQREANLRASLDEFLRLGLEAGLIFVT